MGRRRCTSYLPRKLALAAVHDAAASQAEDVDALVVQGADDDVAAGVH